MYEFIKELWPLNRSLTGDGVRLTLKKIKKLLPNLEIHEVPSGIKAFDWEVPQEWKVNQAYIIDPNGDKFCDFHKNNLHLVGYSRPYSGTLNLSQLLNHLHTVPNLPKAIPYVTSYYNDSWGFCISEDEKNNLLHGEYQVVVDTELFDGSMTYAELLIPGEVEKEIFFSTYICHPSMANNELSGPVVTTFLAEWLLKQSHHYSYRIIFIPETIGSIYYLSKYKDFLKKNVFAGFNLTCVGDERCFSYLPSRHGKTISDELAKSALSDECESYIKYTWLDRGSDERQYCSPGVDLPIASVMRSKYHEYPEYHTSLDKLDTVVTKEGLEGSLKMYKKIVTMINNNYYPISNFLCEPKLSKKNLYPKNSTLGTKKMTSNLMNVLTWCDGHHSVNDIKSKLKLKFENVLDILNILEKENVISFLREKKNESE